MAQQINRSQQNRSHGHGPGRQGYHDRGGFQESAQLRDAIPSPYNFVPLSETVSIMDPEWASRVSHDIPFSNGINGIMRIKLRAESPIYIRNGGAHPQDYREKLNDAGYLDFFRMTHNGPYGIPGSSLKGMIRNVVEIASFSKMALVDDYKYSIRDLNNQKHYTSKLTESISGAYKPRAKAGWLEDRGEGEWVLYPCRFGRVDQMDLARYHGGGFEPWNRQSGIDKYKQWLKSKSLEVDCRIGQETRHSHGKGGFIYSKVDNLGQGPNKGTIVLTGQPAGWRPDNPASRKHKKHMEFVFFNMATTAVPVRKKLKDEFVFVHSTSAGEPNEEWKYWKSKMHKGERVPVFFLGSPENPDSMGLAMMYRLAYDNSVLDAIGHTSPLHRDSDRLDFTQCLLGRVEEKTALRSRVWFRPMIICDESKQAGQKVTTILNNPKPTYYPNYMVQDAGADGRVNGDYSTFMDPDCEIRGWKRYPARLEKPSPLAPTQDQQKVSTAFRPLPEGVEFAGEISLHNVRPEELGAIVWAIRLGDRSGARHSLGMAKPYGFGQVSLQITGAELDRNDGAPVDLESCMQAFVSMMSALIPVGEWAVSPQIKALLDMADPKATRPHDLEYPVLGRGPGNNHFVEYKARKLALKGFGKVVKRAGDSPGTVEVSRGKDTSGAHSGSKLDQLVEMAAGQPLILADLKNAGPKFKSWIDQQKPEELIPALLKAFIAKYPDKIAAWKKKFDTSGKGIFKELQKHIAQYHIEMPE